MALPIIITDAGRAALINAQNTGTGPVLLSQIALGTGNYNPLPGRLALAAEFKRLNTIGGAVVAHDTIHVTIKDESADAYTASEFGIYTDGGVLFAVYSAPVGSVTAKAAPAVMLLAFDMVLSTIAANSVTFGAVQFVNPPATTEVVGVVELATNAETQAGTDATRAVTPAGLSSRTATETRAGLASVATQAQTDTGADDATIVTPKKLATRLNALLVQATELAFGWTKIATQAQTDTGADDATIVTPKKLATRLNALLVQATELAFGWTKIATQAQTDTGTDDTATVTPKKLRAWVKQATEGLLGMAKVATQAQTDAGADDATIVTPKKLRWGVTYSIGSNGYIILPSWLGGFTIQYGQQGGINNATPVNVMFPIGFPSAAYAVVATQVSNGATASRIVEVVIRATTYFDAWGNTGSNAIYWIAVGK